MNRKAHYNSAAARPFRTFLSPKYWPLWILQLFFLIACRLPYRFQLAIGKALGNLAHLLCTRWRRIAKINIKLCFPKLSNEQQNVLVKRHFENLGMSFMETGMAWWLPFEKFPPCHFEGFENYLDAAKQNKGVLLLGPHFTTIDVLGRIISQNYELHVVARHQNNPMVDALLKRTRNAKHLKLIDRKNIRAMIKTLQNKGNLWYAPDQDYGQKHSVFAAFFNIPTATITVPSKIIKHSQSPVVCVAYYRLENAQGFKLVFYPALKNFPSENEIDDARQINHFVETAIREYPEQYLWIHRRFKTRPEGQQNFYEK